MSNAVVHWKEINGVRFVFQISAPLNLGFPISKMEKTILALQIVM